MSESKIEALPNEQTPAKTAIQEQPHSQREFIYKDPGVNIGKGKFGPVDLIIVKNELCALKKISKISIDNPKRLEHVQQEKKLLQ